MKSEKAKPSCRKNWLVVIFSAALICSAVQLSSQQAGVAGQGSDGATVRLPDAPKPVDAPDLVDQASKTSNEIALAPAVQEASQDGTEGSNTTAQQRTSKPVGTAAAPPESTAGATASRPAGAVIAPAKQR